MTSKINVLGVRLNDSLKEKLKFVADYNGRSMSKEIEHLVIKHVEQFEKEHGPIDVHSDNQ